MSLNVTRSYRERDVTAGADHFPTQTKAKPVVNCLFTVKISIAYSSLKANSQKVPTTFRIP